MKTSLQLLVLVMGALTLCPAHAQQIEQIPASKAPTVFRPDDLFNLPAGQWHYAKNLWTGSEACTRVQCEAGYTSGDLVVSVEHSNGWVRVIAGFRNCAPVAFSEVQTGEAPGRSTRAHVEKQVERVVKGAAKTCKLLAPAVANLSVTAMFPGSK